MIKTSVVLRPPDLTQALIRAAMPTLLRAAQKTGEQAIDNIVGNASHFKGGARSRGGVSLSSRSPYRFTISRNPLGPKITFQVRGNQQFMAKFYAQDHGSAGHVIAPSRRQALAFEGQNVPFRGSRAARLAQGTHPVKGPVEHPGTSGTHFYERGIEEAVAAFPSLL